MSAETREEPIRLVSAHRLQAEAVALGFVLRRGGDSPVIDWDTAHPVPDQSFAALDARIADDDDTIQRWADQAWLCDSLLAVANDVLRTGALAVTS